MLSEEQPLPSEDLQSSRGDEEVHSPYTVAGVTKAVN